MSRDRARRHARLAGARPRFVGVGPLGSMLLVAVLLLLATSNAGAAHTSRSTRSDDRARTSYALPGETAVMVSVSNPARSHRLAVTGALVALLGLTSMLAVRVAASRPRFSRPRLEQFHVRRRGPPVLRIAH